MSVRAALAGKSQWATWANIQGRFPPITYKAICWDSPHLIYSLHFEPNIECPAETFIPAKIYARDRVMKTLFTFHIEREMRSDELSQFIAIW